MRIRTLTLPEKTYYKMCSDREYALHHIYVGIQRTSDRDIIRESSGIKGIEKYLYSVLGEDEKEYLCGYVRPQFFERLRLSREEAFATAMENSNAESEAFWLNDPDSEIGRRIIRVSDQMDPDGLDFQALLPALPDMYVVTNKRRILGASAILNHQLMSRIAGELGTDRLAVLPSSIHECIVLDADVFQVDGLSEMVQCVNHLEVEPKERLADRAYIMQVLQGGEIRWVQ
jgi:hypothetical protein